MIEVYGKDYCSYCNSAKALLENRGVYYKYFLIGKDITEEDFKAKFPDKKTVPVIVVDDRILEDGFASLRKEINTIVEQVKNDFGDQMI